MDASTIRPCASLERRPSLRNRLQDASEDSAEPRPTAAGANRDRIIVAAHTLLRDGGREALSTRSITAAAGVQAPTIYRLFGDKKGLLDAVAAHGFDTYVESEGRRELSDDPVEDLRAGWDLHIGFGLANPFLYSLIYGDPRPGDVPPAAGESGRILSMLIRRIAQVGRLRVTEERAADLMYAAGCGTTFTLIGMAEDRRDMGLSEAAREAFIEAITTDALARPAAGAGSAVGAAVALRALLPRTSALSDTETALLEDWLERIADAPAQ